MLCLLRRIGIPSRPYLREFLTTHGLAGEHRLCEDVSRGASHEAEAAGFRVLASAKRTRKS